MERIERSEKVIAALGGDWEFWVKYVSKVIYLLVDASTLEEMKCGNTRVSYQVIEKDS